MIMSRSEQHSAEVTVSKWVAPDVGGGSASHELLSEESIARLRTLARQQGHAEGYEAGLQAGRALVQARMELFEKLIRHLDSPLEQLEPDALEAMLMLCVNVSRGLIRRELSIDNSLVLEAVKSALNAASETESQLRIRVHPQDLELVQMAYADYDLHPALTIGADAAIERGGAIVESGASLIDAQVESRLAAVLESLLNRPGSDDS